MKVLYVQTEQLLPPKWTITWSEQGEQQGCKDISHLSLALSIVLWTTTLVTSVGKVNSLLWGLYSPAILGSVGKTILVKRKFVFYHFPTLQGKTEVKKTFL